MNYEIAKNLWRQEVECPICHNAGMHSELLKAWESLREQHDDKIRVVSGFRCRRKNEQVGGSPTSQHLRGKALDLGVSTIDPFHPLVIRRIIRAGFKGIGRGNGKLHVDVRPKPTFWRYTDEGIVRDDELYEIYKEVMG